MGLTATTIPRQSEPGSNNNEGVLHTPQNWSLNTRCSHTQDTPFCVWSFTLQLKTSQHIQSFVKNKKQNKNKAKQNTTTTKTTHCNEIFYKQYT